MSALLVLGLLAQSAAAASPVPLFTNLGNHHLAITTARPQAQQYFDQGLRLTWAFNHAEAVRAFEAAAAIDPQCAMCWWGVAFALGPNINAPADSTATARAWDAIGRARARTSGVAPVEAALVEALAHRYDPAAVAGASRDSAWAIAARVVATQFPEHDEALTLAADAAMNLRPWAYWEADGSPAPGTTEFLALLETVIARHPDHPGACHLYIHAIEAVDPQRGVACAEQLATLMPGAGHLVHMPAHIYVRVGRYADAVRANQHAVHADETYIAAERPTGLYPAAYYPHNYHFLAFAATFAGMSADAIAAASSAAVKVPHDVARDVPWAQPIVAYRALTLATFGRWRQVLAEPMPPRDLPLAQALVRYARGMAYAATDNRAGAVAEIAGLRSLIPAVPEGDLRLTAEIGHALLLGDMAMREGRVPEALTQFETAKRLEDALPYNEPPYWHQPVRHFLGAALLDAGRAAEAETAYREDLALFPGNGWSLTGLALALRALGRADEAARVEQEFRSAWGQADVTLRTSRF